MASLIRTASVKCTSKFVMTRSVTFQEGNITMHIYHHYTNLTVVRESLCLSVTGRSTEAIRTALKSFSFSASLDLDVTPGSPMTT